MAGGSGQRLTWVEVDAPPPEWLTAVADQAGFSLDSVKSWPDAAELCRVDSSALLLVPHGEGPGKATLSKAFKGQEAPTVLEVLGTKAGDLTPRRGERSELLGPTLTKDEFLAAVEEASHTRRATKRLHALRAHQTRGLDLQGNPALALITTLVKACTGATETKDLLGAALSLQGATQFSEATLLLLHADGTVREQLFWSRDESRGAIESQFPQGEKISFVPDCDFPIAHFFRSDHETLGELSRFNRHPWGTALCLGFRAPGLGERVPANRALLVLFKKDLIPFSEKDSWILELAFHPLSLALEKVLTLRLIDTASQQWRSTFDAVSQPISVVDDEFRIVKGNRALAELVGEDVRSLKGKRCYQLIAGRRSPCQKCPAISLDSAGVRVRTRSGHDHMVWSHRIRTGRNSYKFQFYRNVAKEQELTSQLIQAEKMAALGALVNAIAHELNNPVAGILATAQLLRRFNEPGIPPDALEDIHDIESGALRTKRIIDMLLGFTQSSIRESDEGTVEENVSATLLLARSALSGIQVDVESACPDLRVQHASIHQQILFNLVTNAAHALSKKGKIAIHSKVSGSWLEVSVADNGPGISADKIKRIFDPFVTTKAEGEGTGLGLSIVKNLINRLQGEVKVESAPGEGTKFLLRIPVTTGGQP